MLQLVSCHFPPEIAKRCWKGYGLTVIIEKSIRFIIKQPYRVASRQQFRIKLISYNFIIQFGTHQTIINHYRVSILCISNLKRKANTRIHISLTTYVDDLRRQFNIGSKYWTQFDEWLMTTFLLYLLPTKNYQISTSECQPAPWYVNPLNVVMYLNIFNILISPGMSKRWRQNK